MNVTISLTKRKDLEKIAQAVKESLEETQGRKYFCKIVLTLNLPNCDEVQVEK